MPEKRLTKKELRAQQYEKALQKQLDKAYEYPYCRRCRAKLDPEWAKKLREQKAIPLCPDCFEPMMKKYQENIEKFREMMS